MNGSSHSIKDVLRQAFEMFEKNPEESLVAVTDQILFAATQTAKLNFEPTSSAKLAIEIANEEPFEVGLPYGSISTFRTILARIGTICRAAADKRSITGKAKAFLKRKGVIADPCVTERMEPIQYVQAVIQEQPGSPLYKLDARLVVRQETGNEATLHLEMRNDAQKPSLVISS